MAEGLPVGLVRNREGVTAVDEGADRVELELVARCWRIYSSNRALLTENIGRRLENFFWRIWSSRRLQQRLSGTQVNSQFDTINQGGYIRTTPTASPRSSRGLSTYYREARHRPSRAAPPAQDSERHSPPAVETGPPSRIQGVEDSVHTPCSSSSELPSDAKDSPSSISTDDNSATPTPTSPIAAVEKSGDGSKESRRTSHIPSRPPPILKKEGSSGSGRSARSVKTAFSSSGGSPITDVIESDESLSGADDSAVASRPKASSSRRPTATRFNEEVAVISTKASSVVRNTGERSTKPVGEGSQKPGKRNPIVVASTAASKTRPAFIRQRSSASTSKDVLSKSLSNQHLARSPRGLSASTISGLRSFSGSKENTEPPLVKRSRAASPHPSSQHREKFPDVSPQNKLTETFDYERSSSRGPTTDSSPDQDWKTESSSTQPGSLTPLVDPNFRAKFIDRTRASQRSLIDLPTFARKSSAAVPTSASYQASGTMGSTQAASSAGRGKSRETLITETAPLKAPAPAGPGAEQEDSPAPLPRTKSQLTLLLEKEKARAAKEQERVVRKPEP